mgnify:CR=1
MMTIESLNTTFIVLQSFWDIFVLLVGSIILSMIIGYFVVVFQDEFSDKER